MLLRLIYIFTVLRIKTHKRKNYAHFKSVTSNINNFPKICLGRGKLIKFTPFKLEQQ